MGFLKSLGRTLMPGVRFAKKQKKNWENRKKGSAGITAEAGAEEDPFMQELMQGQLDLSREALNFSKEMSQEQLALAKRVQAIADEKYNYWKTNYQPLEMELVDQAKVGIDPAQYANKAGSEVVQAYGKASKIQDQNLMSYGIDPSSPRYAKMKQDVNIAMAGAEAGARTRANQTVNDINYGRKVNIANLGRGLPAETANLLSSSAGITGAAAGTAQTGYGQSLSTSSNVLNTIMNQKQLDQSQNQFNASLQMKQNEIDAMENAAIWGAVGSLAGAGIGAAFGAR